MSKEEKDDATFLPGARPRRPKGDALGIELRKESIRERLFGKKLQGPRIANRFVLIDHVGSGGMGAVYSAYDRHLDRKVAVKLLRKDPEPAPQARERLIREAHTQAKLSHPNVVQIYDAGLHEDEVYIAMEYLDGGTLEKRLQDSERLGRWHETIDLFIAAGRGLQAAHDEDITHRDFKPGNVLIGKDGRPRVSDFGLARVVRPAQPSGPREDGADSSAHQPALSAGNLQTEHGKILGTPRYMSPEQMQGKVADSRSDQFSFCVALYEALYGQHPFPQLLEFLATEALPVTEEDLKRAIGQNNITPPRTSEIPARVRKVIVRGLSYNPDERFRSMGELLYALSVRASNRLAWALTGLALASVLGLLLFWSLASPSPCERAGREIEQAWSPETRTALARAFAATGLADAEKPWNHAEAQLDEYAKEWQKARVEVCEQSHQVGELLRPTLVGREACLRRRLKDFTHLLGRLRRPTDLDVASVHEDVEALLAPQKCQEGEHDPPPARIAQDVEDVHDQLREVPYLARVQYKQAAALAEKQKKRAEQLEYVPLIAEAKAAEGWVLVHYGNAADAMVGERLLKEAATSAARAHRDALFAEVWMHLVRSAYRNKRAVTVGLEYWERARDAIARIDEPRTELAELTRLRGLLYEQEYNYAAARNELSRALEALEVLEKSNDTSTTEQRAIASRHAIYSHDLANTLMRLGEMPEAKKRYDQAIRVLVLELGESHPLTAAVRFDLARWESKQNNHHEAIRLMNEALKGYQQYFGADHERIAAVHVDFAGIERSAGNQHAAKLHVQKAIDIYEKPNAQASEHDKMPISESARFGLREAYGQLGAIKYDEGEYREAIADYENAVSVLLWGHSRPAAGSPLSTSTREAPPELSNRQRQLLIEMSNNLAEAYLALEDYEQAHKTLDRAEELKGSLELSADQQAYLQSLRGQALLGAGKPDEAVVVLAQMPFDKSNLPDNELADAHVAFACALVESGKDTGGQAVKSAQRALDLYRPRDQKPHRMASIVDAWLSQRNKMHIPNGQCRPLP